MPSSTIRKLPAAAGVVVLSGLHCLAGAQEKAGAPVPEVRSWVPEALRGERLLALEYWQWLGLFLIAFVRVLADHVVRWILRLLSNRFTLRYHVSADAETVQQLG